jgi:hypothetical protein
LAGGMRSHTCHKRKRGANCFASGGNKLRAFFAGEEERFYLLCE